MLNYYEAVRHYAAKGLNVSVDTLVSAEIVMNPGSPGECPTCGDYESGRLELFVRSSKSRRVQVDDEFHTYEIAHTFGRVVRDLITIGNGGQIETPYVRKSFR